MAFKAHLLPFFVVLVFTLYQVSLRGHIELLDNEMELVFGALRKHLSHHVVELLSLHGFEDLVLQVARLLPQARRYVHLTQTVPVHAHSFHLEFFQRLLNYF